MVKVRIETGKAYGETQKFTMCEFCNHEMGFLFSAPLNCKNCHKPVCHVQKILEKKVNQVSMAYTVKWHFSKKGSSLW